MPLIMIEAMVVFAGAACVTHLLYRFLTTRGVLDVPNSRSSHSTPVPRGGGLSIVLTVLGAVLFLFARGVLSGSIAGALIGGGALIAAIGLADDLWSLPAWLRCAMHFVAAGWALWCVGGMGPLDLGWTTWNWSWAGQAVAIIGLVWMINLYNFMDGIDAIAGVEAVSAGALGSILLMTRGHLALAELSLILACSCAGFLIWNWPPAKLFMGDVGSGFIGFVVGVLMIASAKVQPSLIWTWLILMGAFIVDATVTLLRRVIRGEQWYSAHRSHAYQWASRLWNSHAKVTIRVALINVVWLFPLALVATLSANLAPVITAVAFIPLVWIALHLHAGQPAVVTEKDCVEVTEIVSH